MDTLRLLPPIAMSCSHEHAAWPGTVSISALTLCSVISDIRDSLAGQGIDRLAIVNAHGGNYALAHVVQQANAMAESPRMTLYPGREEWASARTAGDLATLNHDDMHAGELETSILLHVAPELVGNHHTVDHQAASRPHLLITGVAGYTDNGVIGSPSLATPTKGAAVLDSLTQQFAGHLKLLA
jgi:creatinine amidohydrolase